MLTKAAVTYGKAEPFRVTEITVDDPNPGEVLVRLVGSGICHTDLLAQDQSYPVPLPAVLGHEGSGVVEKIGLGVTSIQPGDHVVLSYSSCGACANCLSGKAYACEQFYALNFEGKMADGTCRLHEGHQHLSNFFGQASFAHHAVVSARNVVKVPKDVPLEMLGPLGCGIQTGSGAVLNKLKPAPGSSIVIFGTGTVGLSAIMAANVAHCGVILAVDVQENRLELARELGATHTINAKEQNVVETIMGITGKGVHYAIETSGRPENTRKAVDSLAVLGTAVQIGGSALGTEVTLDMNTILFERNLNGFLMGESVPQLYIPMLIALYKQGKFPFDKLIKYYSLEEINQAVQDSKNGTTIKPVIKLG
ncbi:NAD(P)-dependent alcohol dehydrogenase [Aneurinibacillus sp. Ricciae_BoGa-3]|uniref:NAD(P)-dependent alcohol dehydrogenase n=1 Tax=Aneurinibacillus sp. Ricciae_BoGa-3 TaxID=3022697 RepID=UPI00234250B7|nr:NAD(P)-dependent alcohol dehydrogenase [Aneurinibacillus sp. Ricciae_BoGa-3]WCK52584.1 NAD(P)-dependent alcohol dehydrogenase [Aneurinibacillus sp. Ricciae_BoGa-3]